jgi:hypothetical protein
MIVEDDLDLRATLVRGLSELSAGSAEAVGAWGAYSTL